MPEQNVKLDNQCRIAVLQQFQHFWGLLWGQVIDFFSSTKIGQSHCNSSLLCVLCDIWLFASLYYTLHFSFCMMSYRNCRKSIYLQTLTLAGEIQSNEHSYTIWTLTYKDCELIDIIFQKRSWDEAGTWIK